MDCEDADQPHLPRDQEGVEDEHQLFILGSHLTDPPSHDDCPPSGLKARAKGVRGRVKVMSLDDVHGFTLLASVNLPHPVGAVVGLTGSRIILLSSGDKLIVYKLKRDEERTSLCSNLGGKWRLVRLGWESQPRGNISHLTSLASPRLNDGPFYFAAGLSLSSVVRIYSLTCNEPPSMTLDGGGGGEAVPLCQLEVVASAPPLSSPLSSIALMMAPGPHPAIYLLAAQVSGKVTISSLSLSSSDSNGNQKLVDINFETKGSGWLSSRQGNLRLVLLPDQNADERHEGASLAAYVSWLDNQLSREEESRHHQEGGSGLLQPLCILAASECGSITRMTVYQSYIDKRGLKPWLVALEDALFEILGSNLGGPVQMMRKGLVNGDLLDHFLDLPETIQEALASIVWAEVGARGEMPSQFTTVLNQVVRLSC